MKNPSLIVSGILVVAVAVLFYLHFSSRTQSQQPVVRTTNTTANPTAFRIAYFELDSINNSFSMVKDVKAELGREEDRMTNEMNRMQNAYNDKVKQFQTRNQSMSQVESESAQRELIALRQNAEARKQQMDQEYQNMWMQKMQNVKSKIEDFLKEYNRTQGYSYIIANEPNLIYYRDTAYNITGDIIKGLNAKYGTKK